MPSSKDRENRQDQAREVLDVLQEMAFLLNTSLTRGQLSLCISLIENGVSPEAVLAVIKELRKHPVNPPETGQTGQ